MKIMQVLIPIICQKLKLIEKKYESEMKNFGNIFKEIYKTI